jgi:hypothetical protein
LSLEATVAPPVDTVSLGSVIKVAEV